MRVVVDDLGAEVPLGDAVGRIVSLVPNLSEALASWGLGDRLAGVTEWCVEPRGGFPHATRVRGTKNPDVARIVSLGPDLVLANEEENRELDVRRLREAGLAVHVTRVRTVAEAEHSLERVGALVGARAEGTALADRIRAARGRAATAGSSRGPATADAAVTGAPWRGKVFCPVWRDGPAPGVDAGDETWWALGRATFGADLLACAGLDVVPAGAHARYPRHRLAQIATWDPDLVLLPDEPYAFTEADGAAFAGWRAEVALVDGRALWWWGPRTPDALEALRRRPPSPRTR